MLTDKEGTTMTDKNNVMALRDHLMEIQEQDWEIGLTSLKMVTWGIPLVTEMAGVSPDGRSEAMKVSDDASACIGGKAVALLATTDRLAEIAAISDKDEALAEIEKEAQALLGLTVEQAAALFHPLGREQDYCASVHLAVETDDVWPTTAAGILNVLAHQNRVDWNGAYADEERERLWDESGMEKLPSDLLGDAVYEGTSYQLVFCKEGCNGEGFCMTDTIRRSFGIRDGDTLEAALEHKLDYVLRETSARVLEFINAVARDIKQGTTDEYVALDVLRETNDTWAKLDEADRGDWSQYKAHMLFIDVERELGYC